MKNTLAENMLRFGSKNLDAKSVKKLQKLAEQTTQEWRGNAVLTDTANPVGDVKIYPSVFLKDNLANMKPAAVLKYTDKKGLFTGMLNGQPSVVLANLGGQVDGSVEQLVVGPSLNPTGWNEYQWIQVINKYNDTNTLTSQGIGKFLNSLTTVGITTKFGTLTPDRLDTLQFDPAKLKIYKDGIAASGVNKNFIAG